MSVHEPLEQHEHGSHATDRFAKRAALLVSILAACLALNEASNKRAELRAQESLVKEADSWSQYQAKSIRSAETRNLAELAETIDPPADPVLREQRRIMIERMKTDAARYDQDTSDGKAAIAKRAAGFGTERLAALEQLHLAEAGSALMELGIVLTTASVITRSRALLRLALGFAVVGVLIALWAVSWIL